MSASDGSPISIFRAVVVLGLLISGCRGTPPETRLLSAAEAGDLATVKRIVESGGDVNTARDDGMSALMIAIVEGHDDVAAYLIDAGSDLYQAGEVAQTTALMFAAGRNRTNIVIKLIERGADVNQVDAGDFPALFHAAGNGHYEATAVLLGAGAQVDYRSQTKGYTAMQLAAAGGWHDIVRLLAKHGASTNAPVPPSPPKQ